jgi:hypothetical protein
MQTGVVLQCCFAVLFCSVVLQCWNDKLLLLTPFCQPLANLLSLLPIGWLWVAGS